MDGDPITTLVVRAGDLSAETPANDREAVQPEQEVERSITPRLQPQSGSTAGFLVALEQLVGQHGAAVRRFKHIPAAVRTLRQRDLVAHADALGVVAGTAKSAKSILDRHVRDLERQGLVRRHGDHLWLAKHEVETTFANKPAGQGEE